MTLALIMKVLTPSDHCEDLDTVIGDWTAARADRSAARRAIAVNGKTLRGALGPDGRARHLIKHDGALAPSQG